MEIPKWKPGSQTKHLHKAIEKHNTAIDILH